MKRCFVVIIAVAAFFAGAMPVSAETAFNEMSKCIQTWGKGCGEGTKKSEGAKTTAAPKMTTKTDALWNKTPVGTDNSGKTMLGK